MGVLRNVFTGAKGSLTIEFDDAFHELGDEITGMVLLHAEQDLGPGPIRAILECKERAQKTRHSFGSKGGGVRVEAVTRSVFRREYEVKEPGRLPGGTKMAVPFAVRLPHAQDSPHANTPDWAFGVIAILDTLSPTSRSWWWELQIRYDVPGIALADEVRPRVNGFRKH